MKNALRKTLSILAITLGSSAHCQPIITINALGVPYMHSVYAVMAGDFASGEKPFQLNYIDGKSEDFAKNIVSGKAEFSVSDIALSRKELDERKLLQVPAMVTAIVPVVNLPGIDSDKLVLSGPVLAQIMAGTITTWNNDAIRELNPKLNLPALHIKPLARADQSGATLAFTSYLAKASPEFNTQIGAGTSVKWSSVVQVLNGIEVLEAALHDTPGAISYIEMDEGNIKRLTFVRLKHHSGSIVKADIGFLQSGVVGARAATDSHGADMLTPVDLGQNWPILLPIYIALPQRSLNDERMSFALRFIYYTYSKGDDTIEKSGLVPLPVNLQSLAVRSFRKVESVSGAPLVVNFEL